MLTVLEPVINGNALMSPTSSPVKESPFLLRYKIAQLMDLFTKHMSPKEVFDTLFNNYIKLAQRKSEKTAKKFFDLLVKVVVSIY